MYEWNQSITQQHPVCTGEIKTTGLAPRPSWISNGSSVSLKKTLRKQQDSISDYSLSDSSKSKSDSTWEEIELLFKIVRNPRRSSQWLQPHSPRWRQKQRDTVHLSKRIRSGGRAERSDSRLRGAGHAVDCNNTTNFFFNQWKTAQRVSKGNGFPSLWNRRRSSVRPHWTVNRASWNHLDNSTKCPLLHSHIVITCCNVRVKCVCLCDISGSLAAGRWTAWPWRGRRTMAFLCLWTQTSCRPFVSWAGGPVSAPSLTTSFGNTEPTSCSQRHWEVKN